MASRSNDKKIDFHIIKAEDKKLFDKHFPDNYERGCEFSFANLFLWGKQRFSVIGDCIVLFSQFDRRSVYPFPIGRGDTKVAVDAIIADSKARGIPCRMIGLSEKAKEKISELYPNKFRFHHDEGSYDYVYNVSDLADLCGKKYHGKRNHINRFTEAYPDYYLEKLNEENAECVMDMANAWYQERVEHNDNGDYHAEKQAISKALCHLKELGLEGLVLKCNHKVLAFTIGSRMTEDTFDVHFEKGRSDVIGAYAMINREFARFVQKKYPEVLYLNREEDMGIAGLRKAKESYYPCRRIEKCWAYYLEDENED